MTKKLYLWIPKGNDKTAFQAGNPYGENYVEIYNDEENVVSDPLTSFRELQQEKSYWMKQGWDVSAVTEKQKKYRAILKKVFA